eukprot:2013571-Heterocapsa_arctica.AAC.1
MISGRTRTTDLVMPDRVSAMVVALACQAYPSWVHAPVDEHGRSRHHQHSFTMFSILQRPALTFDNSS